MRDFKSLPSQPLLQPLADLPANPLGKIVISSGLISYRAMPVHAYPDGSARAVQTAPGFGTLVKAGRT